MNTAPKRIWLQDGGDYENAFEVTWCQDRIDDTDTEYVRADVIERMREILRKIKWDIDQAQWPEELCMHWVDDVNAALKETK